MATYRLYFMDARGWTGRTAEIDAADDGEAIRLAAAQEGCDPVELRCGDRKICRFEARAPLVAPRPRPEA